MVPAQGGDVRAVYSKKYFDRWPYFLTNSPFKGYYRYIAKKYEPEFAGYRYSLIKGFIEGEEALDPAGKILPFLVQCIALERMLVLSCALCGTDQGLCEANS